MKKIKEYLGTGWYPVEKEGQNIYAWSKKEAFLIFPSNKNGYFLTLAVGQQNHIGRNMEIKIYDAKGKLLKKVIFDEPLKVIRIPKDIKKIKIVVPRTWQPRQTLSNSRDNRILGVCLHRVEDVADYDEKEGWQKQLLGEVCQWNPQVIEIETTSLCNMNPPCVMCNRNVRLQKHEQNMSDVLLERLKHNLKGVHAVTLHGTGEPLLDKRVFDLLEIIGPEIFTRFNTNGLLLNKENCLKIIKSRLKEINVSFDAATAGTYEKIRGPYFLKVKENVKQLVALKKKYQSEWPDIIINLVLMKVNIDEVPGFIDLARELKVQKVYFKLLSPTSIFYSVQKGEFSFHYQDQFLDTGSEEFRKNVQAAFKKCQKFKMELVSPDKEVWNAVSD